MGAPAGRNDGDDDQEHSDKYVLVTEHESEFIGDLPAHSLAVIGEWTRDDDE
jgi:hypothetical protein